MSMSVSLWVVRDGGLCTFLEIMIIAKIYSTLIVCQALWKALDVH